MSKPDLTQARLRELVEYNPESGRFAWKRNRAFTATVGRRAGYENTNGYRRIYVDGVSYAEHRLAWLYVHGKWPAATIDHINRDPLDNRLANLRDVTQGENNSNSRRSRSWRWSSIVSSLVALNP